MKKLLFILGITLLLFAQDDKYLTYVNKLVNYNFELRNVEDRKAPFEIKITPKNTKQNIQKILVKKVKIELLSIFDKQAYIKIDEYLGDQLLKTQKKWVKIGDKIYKCKVEQITLDKVIFKCKNKKLVKSLNKKIPGFKESK
jgi:hypothetical protein